MTSGTRTVLLAGAFALGIAVAAPAVTHAQDQDGQQAAAQDQGGRRGRGQGRGPGGGFRNPTQMVEQLQVQVNDLQLTDEQKTQLQPIFKDATERARTLATEVESLQGRERAEKVMPFARETREKVLGVLTEEQKQTLRKNQANRQSQQFTQRYRRAMEQLDLSADQKTKVDAVLEAQQKKIAELMAAAPPEAGGGGPGGGQFREVSEETRAKLNEILTPEQQQKLADSLRPGQGQGRGGRRGGQGQGNQQ
jgi:Spy/CpxP family protein refolding chaperone